MQEGDNIAELRLGAAWLQSLSDGNPGWAGRAVSDQGHLDPDLGFRMGQTLACDFRRVPPS